LILFLIRDHTSVKNIGVADQEDPEGYKNQKVFVVIPAGSLLNGVVLLCLSYHYDHAVFGDLRLKASILKTVA